MKISDGGVPMQRRHGLLILGLALAAGAWLWHRASPSDEEGWPDQSSEESRALLEEPWPEEPPTTKPHASVRLHGHVVDERREAVSGAKVSIRGPHEASLSATTDESGTFGLDVAMSDPSEGRYVVHVTTEGAAAVRSAPLSHHGLPDLDLGTLRLRPAPPLVVEVRAEDSPTANAYVAVTAIEDYEHIIPRKRMVLLGEGTTNQQGRWTFPHLPQGRVAVYAASKSGRAVRFLDWPGAESGPLQLDLEPTRAVRVRVVDGNTGKAVKGASVWVREYDPKAREAYVYRPIPEFTSSDAEGWATVSGIVSDYNILMAAAVEGRPPGSFLKHRIVADEKTLTITLPRTRESTFSIPAGEIPTPASGTVVTLHEIDGPWRDWHPRTARIAQGHLIVDDHDPEAICLFARAPNGSLAYVGFKGRGGARTGVTAFRSPRRLVVRVLEDDGRPVAGATVFAGTQTPTFGIGATVTDATGTARWAGVYGDVVGLSVTIPGADPEYRRVGIVNLSHRDAGLLVHLPPVRQVILELTRNGRPGLPAEYEVQLRGGSHFVDCSHVKDAPEASELHLRVRPWARERLWFRVDVPGYFLEEQNVPLADKGPTRVPVHVVSACRLEVVVRGREGGWSDSGVQLQLHDPDGSHRGRKRLRNPRMARYIEDNGPWIGAFRRGEQDREGRDWLTGLYPGRYRLVHEASDTKSEEIELKPGGEGRLIINLP